MQPHPRFRRQGRDLHCTLPVTPLEASLGCALQVPTLTGKVRMQLPAGAQQGHSYRLRGQGLPALGRRQPAGDLHVDIVLEIPLDLDPAQRQLAQALGDSLRPEQLPRRQALWARAP